MAQTTITGSEFLREQFEIDDIPLASYLTLGKLPEEQWSSQTFDPQASSASLRFTSTVGSVLSFSNSSKGSGTAGGDSGSMSISSSSTGTNGVGQWSNSWSPTSWSESDNINWTYTGGTASTADDFSYKLKASESSTWSNATGVARGTYKGLTTLDFANAAYAIQLSENTNATFVGEDTTLANVTLARYAFADVQNKMSMGMSATVKIDKVRGEVKFDVKNVKYQSADFTVSTAKFAATMTTDEFDSIPDLLPSGDADSPDLGTIAANIRSFISFSLQADNTIAITSATGEQIDAGAGNDKVSGGAGNDALIGGAGKDMLSGGQGDDTFVLRFDDYDFTSATTLMADLVTDFRDNATESDRIVLEGFGDVAAFKSIADAKKAQTNATVIYESASGKLWYNADGDAGLVGVLNFATVKGIPDDYWAS